jgi:Aspartyl protease
MSTRRSYPRFWLGLGRSSLVLMSWVCLAFVASMPVRAGVDDVVQVLERMRQAAGGPGPAGQAPEYLIEGKADRDGATADYSVRFTPAGMFLQTFAGPMPGQVGFNGRECWSVDWSGMPRPAELYELDRNRLWLGMQTGQWLANADPATISLETGGGQGDEVVLDIKQGRLKAKLHVDRTTWLPTSLKSSGVKGEETWTFADYRGDASPKVPGTIAVARAGRTDTYRIASIRPVSVSPAGVYDPVTTRPDDTRFNPVASPNVEVKRARTGHVLVRPKVDGLDLGWFIFDTGAGGTILDPKAATKMKLEPMGAQTITSFLGTVPTSILRAASLELGPMTVSRPFFMTMDLAFLREAMGEPIVGIIGYDILSRSIAEITLADNSIKLHDPEVYRLDSATWQKLTFNQSLPVVSATFEGHREGRFRIDVGASGPGVGNVIFHAPAVDDLHLLEGRRVTRTKIGPTEIAIGKMAWFELAGHRFENPDVVFAIDRQGPLGDQYLDGNIGVEFLKPFRMVLDFANRRVAFLPRIKDKS